MLFFPILYNNVILILPNPTGVTLGYLNLNRGLDKYQRL